ncbi:uncharacterized protein LOC126572851 [Anopheles aquasalis]|uniref:uncharacterized protein LOC126572851 n=1 Tax=Anopheles aquasalis TaxID=42839 RepID=UPI00215A2DDC|nr:uncharacterized protein LOC126572851 [Anopheles aquasalis]XP_050088493.1 uncharacterized protein LOC126572851 [Anopheles aquasalis]XP_050088494.1 uncharacterized protein LOC126572851 [Anopheles aquasalis]XP_050088495.1 uncharacterized protein LOC126572851 [Anopheles aquasalis]XP_050088496.1 uncharacterized protein LOC126572851 [Anopheles aquasalis]
MYPPILVLLLALVSISRQSSALELLEDDGRYDYSSPYASAGGSLLGYGGPTVDEPPATVSPSFNGAAAAAPPAQPAQPSALLDTVYYQQPKDHQSDYGGSASIEMKTSGMELESIEEKDRAYGGRFNSSEAMMDDDVYFTTSTIADTVEPSSLERNDSAELQPTVPQSPQPVDHEARASVAQAFVSDQHPGEQTARDEPVGGSSSRALDHHRHHHHETPSEETTNLLYTRTDSSTGANGANNDSAEPSNSSSGGGGGGGIASRFDSTETNDGENSVEESQEEDVLVTTTTIPSSLPSDVDSPSVVSVHIPTKAPAYPAIDESKISKTELLSRLIVDKNLRWPIAFLVDASNDSLVFTKKVLDASLVPKSPMDAILLRYNGTGISKSIAFRNTKSLMEAINQLQPSYDRGGSEYYGILRTSQEVPYDSAIFLATSKSTTDPQLSRMTALTLLKKRIRLYILWFGDEMDTNQRLDNQTGLHELAYKTGGRVIQFEIDRDFGSNPLLTSLVSEHDLHGAQTIPIGVDETVHSLYFKLHGHLEQATLETPHGSKVIDLLAEAHHGLFSNSRQHSDQHHSDAAPQQKDRPLSHPSDLGPLFLYQLNTTLPGVYRLNVSSSTAYSVSIKSAQAFWPGIDVYEPEAPSEADEHHQQRWEHQEVELLSNSLGGGEAEPQFGRSTATGRSKLPRASGNDEGAVEEHRFARQTELTDEDTGIISGRASIQAITKVDVGVNSQLIGSRGQSLQLYFEVTNYRQTPITYFFRVTDELSFLRTLNPGQATLSPGQSLNVIVTLVIAPTAEIGSRDKVTFSTTGVDQVSQAAWVTVSDSAGLADTTRPYLWYTYSSRCEGRSTPASCTGAFWTLEITARDYETGLMRISSSPAGLLYKTPFTAGTRDEVRASYTASCCQPRVTVTAYDVSRNVRSLSLDVTDIWLNEAGIAAVVLGILLFIALIILLVLFIRYCIRKRRQSKELPIYRGGGTDSRGTTRRTK